MNRKTSRKRKRKTSRKRKRKVSRKRTSNCISRSPRKPRAIQKRVINYITKKSKLYEALLVVHGTGCGKTLAAVIASQCYLDMYPGHNVVFIGPAGLVNNFKNELKHYGVKNMDLYSFFSFEKFYNLEKKGSRVNCKNSFLIVDEAHNLRTVKSKKALSAIKCAHTAHKRLLLTATPFINSPRDFINIIDMLHGKPIIGNDFSIGKTFTQKTERTLVELLKGRVDYVPSCRDDKDFPDVSEEFVRVPMTTEYEAAYTKAMEGEDVDGIKMPNPKTFLHGYRKVVNKAGTDKYYSAKLTTAISLVRDKKRKVQKTVIFTNWLSFGVDAISKFLTHQKIGFRVYKGGLSATVKTTITDDFNAGKFPVLVITRAGGEGLDLKKVRNIIILDPVWHDAGTQQIIGRAVRYKSHVGLTKKNRHVNVYKMVLTFPTGTPGVTGDQMLYNIIAKKHKVQEQVGTILKHASVKLVKPTKITVSKSVKQKKSTLLKYRKTQLKAMTLTDLKKLCREAGITKKSSGRSLREFRKATQNSLVNLFYKFVRNKI